jgi:hypothetical protein
MAPYRLPSFILFYAPVLHFCAWMAATRRLRDHWAIVRRRGGGCAASLRTGHAAYGTPWQSPYFPWVTVSALGVATRGSFPSTRRRDGLDAQTSTLRHVRGTKRPLPCYTRTATISPSGPATVDVARAFPLREGRAVQACVGRRLYYLHRFIFLYPSLHLRPFRTRPAARREPERSPLATHSVPLGAARRRRCCCCWGTGECPRASVASPRAPALRYSALAVVGASCGAGAALAGTASVGRQPRFSLSGRDCMRSEALGRDS